MIRINSDFVGIIGDIAIYRQDIYQIAETFFALLEDNLGRFFSRDNEKDLELVNAIAKPLIESIQMANEELIVKKDFAEELFHFAESYNLDHNIIDDANLSSFHKENLRQIADIIDNSII